MSGGLKADVDRPLYLQLSDLLRARIAELGPGDRIDSEPVLAGRFGVSRFTVARAIEILVDEGLIRRRQGRGSFVAPPPLRRQPSYLGSFTETIASVGRSATHRLLAFGAVSWRPGCPFDAGEKLVGLDRLRFVDGVPTAIHHSIVAAGVARAIGLDRRTVAAPDFSLYRRFAESGLQAARGVELLSARSATTKEQRLLELEDHAVVMEVLRTTYDPAGVLLDHVQAIYDARRYSYQAEIRSAAFRGVPTDTAKENANAWKTSVGSDFGPRLGPWSDDGGAGGGKAGRAHHRARGAGRSVV